MTWQYYICSSMSYWIWSEYPCEAQRIRLNDFWIVRGVDEHFFTTFFSFFLHLCFYFSPSFLIFLSVNYMFVILMKTYITMENCILCYSRISVHPIICFYERFYLLGQEKRSCLRPREGSKIGILDADLKFQSFQDHEGDS